MKWLVCFLVALSLCAPLEAAVECGCDHSAPATLEARQCSLCREAEKHAEEIFLLKDASPRKPNRWLVLPIKRHGKGQQSLRDLSPQELTALWKASIAKAQEMWPGAWGIAYNADTVRTQCHLHLHIGKLLEGLDDSGGRLIANPAQFPVPDPEQGIWIHPVPGGYHVHTDRAIAEPVLLH
jgi:diadenosine tetraphosphate (Ap4A) HIT family hydrolase